MALFCTQAQYHRLAPRRRLPAPATAPKSSGEPIVMLLVKFPWCAGPTQLSDDRVEPPEPRGSHTVYRGHTSGPEPVGITEVSAEIKGSRF